MTRRHALACFLRGLALSLSKPYLAVSLWLIQLLLAAVLILPISNSLHDLLDDSVAGSRMVANPEFGWWETMQREHPDLLGNFGDLAAGLLKPEGVKSSQLPGLRGIGATAVSLGFLAVVFHAFALGGVFGTLREPKASLVTFGREGMRRFPAFLLFTLAACGAVAIVARLAPLPASEWPTEDLLVLLVPAAALAQTLALGLVVPRYQLPLATASALLAARASRGLRLRAVSGLAVGLAVLVAVVATGLRAYLAAQVDATQTRADQHLRERLASVLVHDGAARIVWRPEDVEQPLGALAHLELSGIRGRVQMLACEGELPSFVGFRDPISRSAPIVVSTQCPGVVPTVLEIRCAVQLPGLGTPWPTLRCYDIPERAVTVRVR